MNEGRIEQEGSPAQFYREPATVFAATFLGCPNILEGRTSEICDEYTAVNCDGQKIYAPGRLPLREKAQIMIRPADIMVNTCSEGPGALLDAVIQQRSFQGVNWQYRVSLKEPPKVQLEVFQTPFSCGCRLTVAAP